MKNNNKCPVLTRKDLNEILFLSSQGSGRTRLICNLYRLDRKDLYSLIKIYT